MPKLVIKHKTEDVFVRLENTTLNLVEDRDRATPFVDMRTAKFIFRGLGGLKSEYDIALVE